MKRSTLHQWPAAVAALILTSVAASANTITVTTTSDNNPGSPPVAGSLRAAIGAARPNDTINFDPSLNGKTIKLQAGQLVLNSSVNINGLGASRLTISGNGKSRVLYVGGNATAVITNLTISLGNGTGSDLSGLGNDANGGDILNNGSLTLSYDKVLNGKASGNGGGIFNAGTLSINDTTVAYNTANLGPKNAPSAGGGIADQGTLTMLRSTVSNNRAFGDGGGIQESGTLNVVNSTFATNKASGSGGAIVDAGGATINISDSTISLNSATKGGGLAAGAPLPPQWQLANTIVAGNTVSGSGSSGPDIYDTFGVTISRGYNGIGNTSGTATGNFIATDKLNVQPKLGPLQDNNGPTFTLAELPGSISINAGSIALIPPGTTTDQRGFGRVNGGNVDIGAFEFYAPRTLKQDAFNIIDPDANQNCSDWEVNWDLWVADGLIQASLNPVLWNGSDTSRLSHWGELVFEFEGGAAGALNDIIEDGSPYSAEAQSAIDDLVMADTILAITAVNDAIAANGNGDSIQNAQNEINAASSDLAKNNYTDAIEHYEQAWINAQRALGSICGFDDGSDEPQRQSVH